MILNELACTTTDEQIEVIDVVLDDTIEDNIIENEEDILKEPCNVISGNVLININNENYEKDNYPPVEGLEIELYNYENLNTPIEKVKPDDKGFYKFENIDIGNYILKLYLPNNYELLEENDENFINKKLLISRKINNENNINIPIKLKKTLNIKGVIFLDKSQSSTYDKGSIGINGIKVSLLDEEDTLIQETISEKFLSIDGFFNFTNLDPNMYKIVIKIEDGIAFTPPKYDLEFGSKASKTFSGIKCKLTDHDLDNAYIGVISLSQPQ